MRRNDCLSYVVAISLWKNWVQVWLTRALGMIALLQNTTSIIYIFQSPDPIYRCAWTYLHISHQQSWSVRGRSDDPQAASVFFPAHPLFFSGRQWCREWDSRVWLSQSTNFFTKSGNRVITSAVPRIPEIGFCPFPPYSCRLPRRLRKYPECCDNSVCMYTSARRRYCWRNYLSGNDLSGTQKAR